ncbi:hypothetical protein [Corynebacterium sp. HMSC06C06]|uniref:hypothetical protein n=1 Tax=Corynebacterium sp. HMSC06C06 TaxID=1581121 RepID=UPI001FEE8CA6|nr:hypothetical protein [Corynebacterium sp. HMSC06C06]
MGDLYPSTGVRVDGARELRRALKQAGLDLKDDIKDAHKSVANTVISRARTLVPVAPTSMTSATPGLLRDSLRAAGTQTAAIARGGKKKVPYANPIHWGWHRRNIKPTLFLTRAASETEPTWVKEYKKNSTTFSTKSLTQRMG